MAALREMISFRTGLAAILCLATLAESHGPPGGWGGHGGGGSGGGGYSGTGTGTGTGTDGFGGGSGSGFGGGGNGGANGNFPGGNGFLPFDISTASYFRNIHGILCGVAMVILFPVGSILMRLWPGRFAIWVHALFQVLAFCVYIAGAGIGIYLAVYVQLPFAGGGNLLTNQSTSYHPIIGLVVLVMLLPQALLGWVHHAKFKKVRRRQVWSYLHLFNGRVGITIGIINGGLGLNLAAASAYKKRVYIIVAAVMWGLWMLVALFAEIRRLRGNRKVADGAVKEAVPPVSAAAAVMTGAKGRGRGSSVSASDRRRSVSPISSRGERRGSRDAGTRDAAARV
ncbi:hypothetical protein OQA88_2138 [Cercophora sp. LCS_1]